MVYNVGTITLIVGIALLIYFHGFNKFLSWHVGFLIGVILLIILVCWKWISDLLFLLFEDDNTYNDYKNELKGENKPKPEKDWLMLFHKRIREKCRKK